MVIQTSADFYIKSGLGGQNVNKSSKTNPEGETYKVQRSSPRFPPTAYPALKGACLVSGSEVKLINISKGGALLECSERLAPRTRISLRLITTGGIIQLYGQVLRSTITHINGGMLYRSAVAFEREFPLQAQSAPAELQRRSTLPAEPQPGPCENPVADAEPMPASDRSKDEDDGLVTLIVRVMEEESDLRKLLQINKW